MKYLGSFAAAVIVLMGEAQAAPTNATPAMAPPANRAAAAQASEEPVASYALPPSAIGRWVYDQAGNKIGSVRSLSDDRQTVVIMIGSYFQPGSHESKIPVNTLSVVNGKVLLRTGMTGVVSSVSR